MSGRFIDPAELASFGATQTLGDRAAALLRQQRAAWPAARDGYAALDVVQSRSLQADGSPWRVQFNPRRIVSSAAKVDAASIAARPCFLCEAHLPAEQRGLDAGDGLALLVNPFPILPEHFTIPRRAHQPQRIAGAAEPMLRLAVDLAPRYLVFYNGPECGASAPDHFHFQAGSRGTLPIERELPDLIRAGRALGDDGHVDAHAVGRRRFMLALRGEASAVAAAVERAVEALPGLVEGGPEPRVNLLAWHEGGRAVAVLIPRARHRPTCYSAEGEARMLLSPASIDLGGLLITPLERDFARVDAAVIERMLEEVCVGEAGAAVAERVAAALA